MDFDLSADAREIQTLLADSVALYLQGREVSPEDHPSIRRVELAFLIGHPQPPVISVDFDAREDAQEDGDATHRCFAQLHRPAWEPFVSLAHGIVTFTFPDGSQHDADVDAVDRTIGAFLVSVLQEARGNGTFEPIAAGNALMLGVTYEGFPV